MINVHLEPFCLEEFISTIFNFHLSPASETEVFLFCTGRMFELDHKEG